MDIEMLSLKVRVQINAISADYEGILYQRPGGAGGGILIKKGVNLDSSLYGGHYAIRRYRYNDRPT
jgi:hypothetical protein